MKRALELEGESTGQEEKIQACTPFKFRLLARSNPLGYAAFLVFLKIGSMATGLKRPVHSPARQQVSD